MQYTSEADLSELLWLDFASRFTLALPIPYVQAAILNLLNPYNPIIIIGIEQV